MSPEPDYLAALDPSADATAMSLARIRQLAAHETGHTLGFAHNFAASTYGRALGDGLSGAVGRDQGRQARPVERLRDRHRRIRQVRRQVRLRAVRRRARTRRRSSSRSSRTASPHGMLYIADADARPASAAHPLASLWDNGADPIATLKHEMEVRRIGLVAVRPEHDPRRHAAVRARAQAAAAVPPPSLPAAGGGEVARRRLFHLRREDGVGTESRPSSPRSSRRHAEGGAQRGARHDHRSRRLRIPERILRPDPADRRSATAAGRRSPSTADRSDVRPDRRGHDRRRHHDLGAAAARACGADDEHARPRRR